MFGLLVSYSGVDLLIVLVAYILALLLAFSLHEFAHAFVAHKQGDMTPKTAGRLTVNPLAHIDPIGFLSFVLLGFGWAKPVPINPLKFRNFKKGMFWVSVAGVLTNLVLAFISLPLLLLTSKYLSNTPANLFLFLESFLSISFSFNVVMFVFNLLPINPLDGFKVVETFTKYDNKYVQFMKKNGTIILIAFILLSNVFGFFGYLVEFVSIPIQMFWNLII